MNKFEIKYYKFTEIRVHYSVLVFTYEDLVRDLNSKGIQLNEIISILPIPKN